MYSFVSLIDVLNLFPYNLQIMVESINVRLPEKLREFVEQQTRPHGTYESVSEYVRALIRQDYERLQALTPQDKDSNEKSQKPTK